jgi:hypothetical protein
MESLDSRKLTSRDRRLHLHNRDFVRANQSDILKNPCLPNISSKAMGEIISANPLIEGTEKFENTLRGLKEKHINMGYTSTQSDRIGREIISKFNEGFYYNYNTSVFYPLPSLPRSE